MCVLNGRFHNVSFLMLAPRPVPVALERKAVLAVALKEGGKFLAQFLGAKSCRLLQALFARREAQTLKMVAKLQKATRQMQVTTRARSRSVPSILSHPRLCVLGCGGRLCARTASWFATRSWRRRRRASARPSSRSSSK
jgi:hypothetical protein